MRKLIALFLLLACFMLPSAMAGERVNSNLVRRPVRLLTKQFSAGANVFTTADPSLAGSALTLTSATGDSSNDGIVTVALNAGFTAPITLTVYFWLNDPVTPANSGWVRLGGTSQVYSTSVDTNYSSVSFAIPEFTPFLIRSSAAITGNVYVDAQKNTNNNNSAAGF